MCWRAGKSAIRQRPTGDPPRLTGRYNPRPISSLPSRLHPSSSSPIDPLFLLLLYPPLFHVFAIPPLLLFTPYSSSVSASSSFFFTSSPFLTPPLHPVFLLFLFFLSLPFLLPIILLIVTIITVIIIIITVVITNITINLIILTPYSPSPVPCARSVVQQNVMASNGQ